MLALSTPAAYADAAHYEDRSEYLAPRAVFIPIVDGVADEAVWEKAPWQDLSHRWLGPEYSAEDFQGRYKVVWTEDKIKRYLTDEYVIVSLYVDEREELPEEQHIEVDRMDGSGRTRLINTVGKKWQYLQQSVYSKLSQPYYVLVSPDGTTLNPPVAYTADVDTYEDFLECGLQTYRKIAGSK